MTSWRRIHEFEVDVEELVNQWLAGDREQHRRLQTPDKTSGLGARARNRPQPQTGLLQSFGVGEKFPPNGYGKVVPRHVREKETQTKRCKETWVSM